MPQIIIRASALNSIPDCEARAAIPLFYEEITGAGFELRKLSPHVGGIIGTSVHSGASYSLKEKMKSGEITATTMNQSVDAAISRMEEDIETAGIIWDDTTRRRDEAQQQIRSMVREVHRGVLPHIREPVLVEEEIKAMFPIRRDLVERGYEVVVVGHPDAFEPTAGHDHKTGVIRRPNAAQYGLYSRLGKAHGFAISKLFEHYIQRASVRKPQPAAETFSYDVDVAERAATSIVNRLVDDLVHFTETADEWSFNHNPNSMLCSERFCQAHSTPFCRVHKGAEGSGNV